MSPYYVVNIMFKAGMSYLSPEVNPGKEAYLARKQIHRTV